MKKNTIPMILIVDRALAGIGRRERALNFNGERLNAIVEFKKEMKNTLPNNLEEAQHTLIGMMWEEGEEINLIHMAGDTPDEMTILRHEMMDELEMEIKLMIDMQ